MTHHWLGVNVPDQFSSGALRNPYLLLISQQSVNFIAMRKRDFGADSSVGPEKLKDLLAKGILILCFFDLVRYRQYFSWLWLCDLDLWMQTIRGQDSSNHFLLTVILWSFWQIL
jgi:hypothetical protein